MDPVQAGRSAVLSLRACADARVVALRNATISKSYDSYRSKIRSYVHFCEFCGEDAFPVWEPTVTRYAALFKNGRSANGYLIALAWVCDATGFPVDTPARMWFPRLGTRGRWMEVPAWRTRGLSQVLRGSVKSSAPPKRAVAISPDLAARLARFAASRNEPYYAFAYVLASVFMFRVQDELLPLCSSNLSGHSSMETVWRKGELCLAISLRSRKNRPEGVTMIRRCMCTKLERATLCPVHAFVEWQRCTGRVDGRMFPGIDYVRFTRVMRAHLVAVIGTEGGEYTSHGFRRGTAQAMLTSGSNLAEILSAGDWRSPAFLAYLEQADVEEEAVLDALMLSGERESMSGRVSHRQEMRQHRIDRPDVARREEFGQLQGEPVGRPSPQATQDKGRKRVAAQEASRGCRKISDFFPPPAPSASM